MPDHSLTVVPPGGVKGTHTQRMTMKPVSVWPLKVFTQLMPDHSLMVVPPGGVKGTHTQRMTMKPVPA